MSVDLHGMSLVLVYQKYVMPQMPLLASFLGEASWGLPLGRFQTTVINDNKGMNALYVIYHRQAARGCLNQYHPSEGCVLLLLNFGLPSHIET